MQCSKSNNEKALVEHICSSFSFKKQNSIMDNNLIIISIINSWS